MNRLGEFIRKSRGEMSLRDFASLCDLSYTYIDNLEKGRDPRSGKPVSITMESLIKIAKGLNLELLDLVDYAYKDGLEPSRENKFFSGALEKGGIQKELSQEEQRAISSSVEKARNMSKRKQQMNK